MALLVHTPKDESKGRCGFEGMEGSTCVRSKPKILWGFNYD